MSPLRTVLSSLIACGSQGGKPWWLSNLEVSGARLSGAGLKSWGARCGVQPLCSSGISSVVSSLLIAGCCTGFKMRLSQPLLPASMCVFFSRLPGMEGSLVVLGFLSGEDVLYVAVDSVCPWWEVSSESSSVTILNWNHISCLFDDRCE